MTTHDALDAALAEREQAIREQHDREVAACRAYVEHLRAGGDPHVVAGWYPPEEFVHTKGHVKALADGWREATGQPPNPFDPGSVIAYKLIDRLLAADGEFVLVGELRKITKNQQVETFLKSYRLAETSYVLEKGKLDGKVAYRLITPEEAAA